MNISALSMLAVPGGERAAPASDPGGLAREFDAMVLRIMMGDLGKSMAGGDELLGTALVGQLAATANLGFGAALLQAATGEASR